ncbi:MAG: hypothetical protein ACO35Q_08910, partial [Prochlorothrix sp.]
SSALLCTSLGVVEWMLERLGGIPTPEHGNEESADCKSAIPGGWYRRSQGVGIGDPRGLAILGGWRF